MKYVVFSAILLLATMCKESPPEHLFTLKDIEINIGLAVEQYKYMDSMLRTRVNRFPISADQNGNLESGGASWWTAGFYPGALCLLYGETKDEILKIQAEKLLSEIEPLQYSTENHDIGWIINSSFGNFYRLTIEEKYGEVLIQTAKSLLTRYNPAVGSIRSWDKSAWTEKKGWVYPVNIDNMMNLELLMEAYKITSDSAFLNIAIQHADRTLKDHFRADNSSYHLVDYNPLTGKVRKKQTSQGYSDASSWARGQAWGLYGFTMMYRETGKQRYLEQAQKIADFLVHHPRLPEDKIPYWDFDAPDIPHTYKDASAGAIICSALVELSQYVDKERSEMYRSTAEQQLISLSSPYYHAQPGENAGFILKHGVGALPADSEVDVPLIYADYYYIEAMVRLKKLLNQGSKD